MTIEFDGLRIREPLDYVCKKCGKAMTGDKIEAHKCLQH